MRGGGAYSKICVLFTPVWEAKGRGVFYCKSEQNKNKNGIKIRIEILELKKKKFFF